MERKRFTKKQLIKPFLFAGMGLLGLTLALWGGASVYAHKKTVEMDAIAQDFFQQYPETEWNKSALMLKQLVAEVGISRIINSDTEAESAFPEATAEALETLRNGEMLDYFNAQNAKTQGPVDPLPENIQTFLTENADALENIQNHLLSHRLPVFPLDVDAMGDFSYALPSFFSLVEVQKLLLLKAIHHAQQNQPDAMATALEASAVVTASVVERPDILSYLISLIMTEQSMTVMRGLDNVPPEVASQLLEKDLQQIGVARLQFEN